MASKSASQEPLIVPKRSTIHWKGCKVPYVTGVVERLDKLEAKFHPKCDDIWICAYPKSGTHWLNEILFMLKTGTTKPAPLKVLYFAEMTDHSEWEVVTSPRVLNTHLPYPVLPNQIKESKIVFILRNPKDVAVSFYNHSKHMHEEEYDTTWDNFYSRFIADEGEFQCWFNYTRAWMSAVEAGGNILWLLYEDLNLNPKSSIRQLAEFMGCTYDEAFYEDIVVHTHISKMKESHEFDTHLINGKSKPLVKLLRKGVIGDWKNWFNEKQNQHFNDKYTVEMKGLHLGIESYMDL